MFESAAWAKSINSCIAIYFLLLVAVHHFGCSDGLCMHQPVFCKADSLEIYAASVLDGPLILLLQVLHHVVAVEGQSLADHDTKEVP